MPALKPQEIYLLERYTSIDYFGALRDTWGEMIQHVEESLNNFMADLLPDYRRRHVPEQPDVVWGERVLPNFRNTFASLCDGFITLSHGDLTALKNSYGPMNNFKGQTDFWAGWMSTEEEFIYRKLLGKSVLLAGNISTTIGGYWNPGVLTEKYDEDSRGLLDAPASWPLYELVNTVAISSGDVVMQSGIYLPNTENSCAEFIYAGRIPAPDAVTLTGMKDLFIPGTQTKYAEKPIHEKRSCIWTLVRRCSNSVTGKHHLY